MDALDLLKNVWIWNFYVGSEAFDPVWSFSISDKLHFFWRNEITSWGKKRTALFQTHNWEKSSQVKSSQMGLKKSFLGLCAKMFILSHMRDRAKRGSGAPKKWLCIYGPSLKAIFHPKRFCDRRTITKIYWIRWTPYPRAKKQICASINHILSLGALGLSCFIQKTAVVKAIFPPHFDIRASRRGDRCPLPEILGRGWKKTASPGTRSLSKRPARQGFAKSKWLIVSPLWSPLFQVSVGFARAEALPPLLDCWWCHSCKTPFLASVPWTPA